MTILVYVVTSNEGGKAHHTISLSAPYNVTTHHRFPGQISSVLSNVFFMPCNTFF